MSASAIAPELIRAVSAEARTDSRSVHKLLRGQQLAATTRQRIIRALRQRGLDHLVPVASAR
jgi:hypothetical protein